MAEIKLTIHGFLKSTKGSDTDTMTLVTGTTPAKSGDYLYSLVGFSMNKQMYQPTSIVADISISKEKGKGWAPIDRSDLGAMFRYRRISIYADHDLIGDDFYVHEVIPEYKRDNMAMKLKIYSLDKLLTIQQTSRSFVGKKLVGDILAEELPKYKLPYDNSKSIPFDKTKRINNVQQLVYQNAEKVKVEHIFPYLVQYNESFYDLLARTTNRWGEFLYYEDGMLQIGYDKDEKRNLKKDLKNFYKISYYSQNMSESMLAKISDGGYEAEAAFDKYMYDMPVQKSPNFVKGELGKFNGEGDKYAMKKIASFFNTDKNIISWLFNTLVDDGVKVLQAISSTKLDNNKFNDQYFPKVKETNSEETKAAAAALLNKVTPQVSGKTIDDQEIPSNVSDAEVTRKQKYGQHEFTLYDDVKESKDAFNEFTELSNNYASKDEIYDAKRYNKTLALEREAGNNIVVIDYDTTWPELKLANIIEVNGERFIVTNITASYDNSKLTFQVKASGAHVVKVDEDKNKKTYSYYPAVIPTGHVRYSGPQMATVKDADDPSSKNRVRVVFSWQGDAGVNAATPWVLDGKMTACKHKKKDEVLMGFVDGNVERPYVIGALKTKSTVEFKTPGGHKIEMDDGTGAGLLKFITSAFSPILDTIFDFVPVDKIPKLGDLFKDENVWKKNKNFEGGFTMSDNYGIYKISGSTDERLVKISSPWGDVKIDAFTGITISAPNGDVKIKGKNISIEAGNNLTLESGKNIGWKLGNDKKFGNFSAAALGLTVTAAIANKVAEKTKILDLSLVRSVVEVVMRPVEGALTVKSNRYLKLETGKNECEYPKLAFNETKKDALLKAAYKKSVASGASSLSDGIVELFRLTAPIADTMISKWSKLYQDCCTKKATFDNLINQLTAVSNDNQKTCCKLYADLKDKFWDTDKNKVIEEGDLEFTDNVKIDGNNIVATTCFAKVSGMEDADIIEDRKNIRLKLVDAAKELRKAIVKIQSFEMTQEEVDQKFGFFRWTSLPQDSKKNMFTAISKEKCALLPFYKLEETVKNLDTSYTLNNDKKFCRRAFCLNLLKELKLDNNRAELQIGNPPAPKLPDEPSLDKNDTNYIMNLNVWNFYVSSLQTMPKLKKDSKMFGQTIKDAFTKQFTDMKEAVNFKKSYQEMYAWADGNPGGILFGVGEKTYMVEKNSADGDAFVVKKIERFEPIEQFTAAEAEGDEGKAIEKFMKQIKDELTRY